jgi:hypothetical protein
VLERLLNAGAAGAVSALGISLLVLVFSLLTAWPRERLRQFKQRRADKRVDKAVADFRRKEAEFEASLKKR